MRIWDKYLLVSAALVGLALGSARNASATINGQPDGTGHPFVVAVVTDIDGVPHHLCSGSLIAPTVVLTAGHCTYQATGGRIWLDSQITDPYFPHAGGDSIEAKEIHTDPDFCLGCAPGFPGYDTHDVGIVVLSQAVTLTGYALLPSPGLVDALPMMTALTIVGYGAEDTSVGVPPHYYQNNLSRNFATSLLVQSNDPQSDEYIKITSNPADGKGGVCAGDSGGPDLLGNIVLAVNSYIPDLLCAGVAYSNRIDTAYALAFINSFLK